MLYWNAKFCCNKDHVWRLKNWDNFLVNSLFLLEWKNSSGVQINSLMLLSFTCKFISVIPVVFSNDNCLEWRHFIENVYVGWKYRVVQLGFTATKVLSMLFDTSLPIFTVISVKQHKEYLNFRVKNQLDLPVQKSYGIT